MKCPCCFGSGPYCSRCGGLGKIQKLQNPSPLIVGTPIPTMKWQAGPETSQMRAMFLPPTRGESEKQNVLAGYRTYISAAVTLIVAALIKLGVITPETADQTAQTITSLLENIGAVTLALIALMQIFQRKATANVEAKAEAVTRYGNLSMVLVCLMALPLLAGCSQLTGADGSPIAPPGAVCVDTEWGRICRMPNEPPPPALLAAPPPAPVPALAK